VVDLILRDINNGDKHHVLVIMSHRDHGPTYDVFVAGLPASVASVAEVSANCSHQPC